VDPREALAKIGKALPHPKKAAKAAALLRKLADAQLTPQSAPLFRECLEGAFLLPGGGGGGGESCGAFLDVTAFDGPARAAYGELCDHFLKHLEAFAEGTTEAAAEAAASLSSSSSSSSTSPSVKAQAALASSPPFAGGAFAVGTLVLAVGTRGQLTTDDTYVFAAAMKKLRAFLEEMPPLQKSNHDIAPVLTARRLALLSCLEAAWATNGTKQWAKPEVEHTFQVAAERRLRFDASERDDDDEYSDDGKDHERERLDILTTKMRESQRKTIVNRTVRASNSIAHPLRRTASSVSTGGRIV
jgi:hypothetical protein